MDEYGEALIDKAVALACAIDHAGAGRIEEAVKRDTFCHFVSDMTSFYDDLPESDCIMENIRCFFAKTAK